MVPVVEALARSDEVAAGGGRVSVDTVKPEVAEAALSAGASLVNDISASLWDVAAASGAGWVAMHMQGRPGTMQDDPSYEDVVAEVGAFVLERAARALAAGVSEVWVDPGIGFGKTIGHNLSLLRHLPGLVAASQSAGAPACWWVEPQALPRWLASTPEARRAHQAAPVEERAEGSLATAAAAMVAGAGMVRVHDVAATVQVARLYGPAA